MCHSVAATPKMCIPPHAVYPDLKSPHPCPLDEVIKMDLLVNPDMPPSDFGAATEIREHSFLQNPRRPASLSSSRARLRMCAGATGHGALRANETFFREALVPGALTVHGQWPSAAASPLEPGSVDACSTGMASPFELKVCSL